MRTGKSNVERLSIAEKNILGISIVILTTGIFALFFVSAVCAGLVEPTTHQPGSANLMAKTESMEFSCPASAPASNPIVCQWAETVGIVESRYDGGLTETIAEKGMDPVEVSSTNTVGQQPRRKRRNPLARVFRRGRRTDDTGL